MSNYINVTPEAGKAFFSNPPSGKITMLNLLCFRKEADYSASPELAPANAITGKNAYKLYMKHTKPILEAAGGEVLFMGKCNSFLIGPEAEKWDLLLLVRHQSAEVFLEFAQNKEYLKGIGHRTAALEDSRLLPITEGDY